LPSGSDQPFKAYVDTDPGLGLTPIAEPHPTIKTFEPSDMFCRLFTLAFRNRELSGRRAEAILDWHRLFEVPACKI
jgi:hypothetical protein